MKLPIQGTEKQTETKKRHEAAHRRNGPSRQELEYLNQIVSELKEFLESRSVTTVNNIYLGFQGDNYSGQMLLSKGA
ncbi:MAG: hypothetical protein ACXVB9_07035 [Bdellovibrionota bacterium]